MYNVGFNLICSFGADLTENTLCSWQRRVPVPPDCTVVLGNPPGTRLGASSQLMAVECQCDRSWQRQMVTVVSSFMDGRWEVSFPSENISFDRQICSIKGVHAFYQDVHLFHTLKTRRWVRRRPCPQRAQDPGPCVHSGVWLNLPWAGLPDLVNWL